MRLALLALFFITSTASAATNPQPTPSQPEPSRGFDTAPNAMDAPESGIRFQEHLRSHSLGETTKYVGILYGINILGYIATQQEAIHTRGSWATYRGNLFKVTRADYDTWTYNWGTHVLTGAATNLFYRSRAYSRFDSLMLTALQSALFEFTIEVYSEPASLEDLVNTPILGCVAATFLEWASFSLLNTDSWFLHGVGHVLNPFTLFGFHEGEVQVKPELSKDHTGVALQWHF
jgi:hypothetical protein